MSMASSHITSRLQHLYDSAHVLSTTAPATSRYLMAQCNSIMFAKGIHLPSSHKRKACSACGTIMILGWNGKLEPQPRTGPRKDKSGKAVADRTKTMVYNCESCGRKTLFNISIPSSFIQNHKPVTPSHINNTLMPTQSSDTAKSGHSNQTQSKSNKITSPSGNLPKKNRTKARNQGGLEAILARQKAIDSRDSSNFDLLDFMKKA